MIKILKKNVELAIENNLNVENDNMESILSLVKEIKEAINENIQGPFMEGCVIKDGYDKELDELREI